MAVLSRGLPALAGRCGAAQLDRCSGQQERQPGELPLPTKTVLRLSTLPHKPPPARPKKRTPRQSFYSQNFGSTLQTLGPFHSAQLL